MGKQKRRKRNRAVDPLAVIIPAAAAVMLILVLAVLLFKKQDAETVMAEPETFVAKQEAKEEPGEEADRTQGSESEAGHDGSETETLPRAAEENSAAGVGSMEDSEDPQGSTKANASAESGAAVDVSAVQAAAGENANVTLGIDVSKYQGNIDWAAVRDAGVEFAMIRVGYRTKVTGILYEDPAARYNLQEATKNGIKAGAYFFSSAVNEEEVKEEAAWVAGLLANYKITYPVAYNCEDFQASDSRQHDLTKEERTQLACVFLDQMAAYGYQPMFYASRNEMEGSAQWDMSRLSNRYKIWVSQYPDKPFPETAASTYSGVHAMWQYTSQGQVAGIGQVVDVNVAYFGYDREADAKDATPARQVEANPELGIDFTEVDETVTAKNETNLRDIPSTEGSTVVYLLKNGETLQRTGVGNNGWDRLIYNGQKVYAVHEFLTALQDTASAGTGDARQDTGAAGVSDTVGGMAFRTVNEAVTARDKVNLRDFPSTETGNVVGTLSYGEAVVRTGVYGSGDTGWSRLSVNGQVVYASSRLLATSMDYKEQEKITNENPEAGMHFVAASGTVMAKDGQTNLRTLPTTNEPSAVVAVLTGDMTLQRVGIDKDKGWTKLVYNGQTVYAVTNYLKEVE